MTDTVRSYSSVYDALAEHILEGRLEGQSLEGTYDHSSLRDFLARTDESGDPDWEVIDDALDRLTARFKETRRDDENASTDLPMTVDAVRAVKRAPIEVGEQYEFYAEMQQGLDPPDERMRNHTGQKVTVVRPLRGQDEPNPESDWFEPTEDEQPEVSRGYIVRAADGTEFTALEEELNGWDHDLGQFFWPDGTHGWDHDRRFLANEIR